MGFDLTGMLDARPLPTIELPHGRPQATFRMILARAWAVDTHLVRDVALATSVELWTRRHRILDGPSVK